MSVRKSASLAIAGMASATMVFSAVAPAHAADTEQWFSLANTGKPANYSIPAGTIVGTGSDTTQFLVGKLAADYNAAHASAPQVLSLAACDVPGAGASILTSCSAPASNTFPETFPASGTVAFAGGSGPGANLLNNAGATKTDIAFSRASGLQQTDKLANYPFAVDQLVPVVSKNVASNAPATISRQELAQIFQGVYTNWKQLGGKDAPIHAYYIKNTGSGTFQYFGQQLETELGKPTGDKGIAGYTAKGTAAPGNAFVANTDLAGKDIIEHDPSAIVNDPNAITAMSYSRIKLGAQVEVLPGFIANRPVFNVLRDQTLTPSTALAGVDPDWIAGSSTKDSPTNLVNSLFGPNGYFCSDAATAAIAAQGFFQLDSTTCGIPVTAVPANLKAKGMAIEMKSGNTLTVTDGKAGVAKVVAAVAAKNAVAGAPAITGTVTFKLIAEAVPGTTQAAGGSVSAPVVNGTATATVPATVPAGTYQISAAYSGDANYQTTWTDGTTANEAAVINVTGADKPVVSTPALGTAGNPTPVTSAKAPAKLKAGAKRFAVTFAGPVPSAIDGKVTVFDGKKKIGTFTVVNGKATIKLKKQLKKGKHKIKLVLAASATSKALTKTVVVQVK